MASYNLTANQARSLMLWLRGQYRQGQEVPEPMYGFMDTLARSLDDYAILADRAN